MPLTAPKLDTRTFADLVEEARQRIPRFTPEWTNLNDSDPGMTLVQLNAWLAETILYELNRVPELNYVKFLDLLQIKRAPARASRTELAFTLKKLSEATAPLTVLVPLGAKVEVDDPDLTEKVLFETDYSMRAINAAVGAAIVTRPGVRPLELVTTYDDKTAKTTWRPGVLPFGAAPAVNSILLLGLVLRPHINGTLNDYTQDVFPAGQLDIFVDASQPFDQIVTPDADGSPVAQVLDTAQSRACLFPWEVAAGAQRIVWQIYTGSSPETDFSADGGQNQGWTDLAVAGDETTGLTRSGHLRLEIPERIGRASMDQLDREEMWLKIGLPQTKPPVDLDDLLDDLDGDLEGLMHALDKSLWQKMGLPEAHLNAVLKCDPTGETKACNTGADIATQVRALDLVTVQNLIDPGALTAAEWRVLVDAYAMPATPAADNVARRLYWIRAVLKDAADYDPVPIAEIRLNTVNATAAASRVDERLGASDGRPGQVFKLAKAPVYFDPKTGVPDAEVEVAEDQQTKLWNRVDDFFRTGASSEVYVLDETTGEITFGDGRRGRIPVAGARIRAVRYRTGGGAIGNVGPGSITKLVGAIQNVDSVTNPRAAANGADAETLDEVILRAPTTLRIRDRAVSQSDFAFLASETPGVAVHKAYAVAGRRYDKTATPKLVPQAGSVSVIILPSNDEDTPLPSEAQLRAVCEYLEPRRLITTELHVAGPDYVGLSHLTATLRIKQDADIKSVSDAAIEAVLTLLHPQRGGVDGGGWPFGEPIYHADIYDRLLALTGVRRVSDLSLGLEGGASVSVSGDPDILALPEGALPHLRRDVIEFKVIYDRLG